MTNPCQGHAAESARADYMKEAERLLDELSRFKWAQGVQMAAGEVQSAEILQAKASKARVALLEHIQRGAVPEGFALVPLVMNREMEDVVAQDEWQWCDLLAAASAVTIEQYNEIAAAPAPDQFRDAAKMMAEPADDRIAAAIHYPECWDTAAYPTVESALAEVFAHYRCTEHDAPAGVPMPKPVAYGFGNTAITGHTNRLMMVRIDIPGGDQYAGAFWLPLVLADEAHTYGVACRAAGEAAGYARGLRDAVRDADIEALRLYVRALCKAVDAATDFIGTVAGGASWWDDVWADHAAALDRARERISQAALRGEVKP